MTGADSTASPARESEQAPPTLSDEEFTTLGRILAKDLPDAVILADRTNIIQYWNAGAVRIFGFSADEATGESLDIIIPERLRARHWDGFKKMMETGRSSHAPDELLAVPATTKSGANISIQFTVAPVLNDDGTITGIVALLRDVTETFSEIRRLRTELKATKAT